MESLQRLSASQLFLYNTIASTSSERARRSVKKANLTASQTKQLTEALKLLQSDNVRIILNVDLQKVYPVSNLSVIDGLMSTGRLLNRFEIELTSPTPIGPNMLSRIMEEFLLYGAKPPLIYTLSLLPAGERPNYGALDFIGNQGALPMLGYYGPYRFKLKKETLQRSTFTVGSIAVNPSNQVYTWDTIAGILVSTFPSNGGERFLFEDVVDRLETGDYFSQLVYIEAQILGGIFLKSDIDLLYYPAADRYSIFYQKLEQLSQQLHKATYILHSLTTKGDADIQH